MKDSPRSVEVVEDQNESSAEQYGSLMTGLVSLLEAARRQTVRAVNALLTASYWEIGRRIVVFEQKGSERAGYGEELLKRLSTDLTARFGRGFSPVNLSLMKRFYLLWPETRIFQTPSEEFNVEHFSLRDIMRCFPLPWSTYVRMFALKNEEARAFYEKEALRGGWSVRHLERQINSQFYERTLLSKNKASMLRKGEKSISADVVTPEEEIKDPYILEFLGLKDEYSENDLEDALIHHLEVFLLELGGNFSFVARQKRLRIGSEWCRADLVFFHRGLRCLVLIDLKLGRFTHADAGQMHMYLNYARKHWALEGENPPVGLILCASKDDAMAKYALEGFPNKVMTVEYQTALPDEAALVSELKRTQRLLLEREGKRLKEVIR